MTRLAFSTLLLFGAGAHPALPVAVYEQGPDSFSYSGRIQGTMYTPSGGALATADLTALDGSPAGRPHWSPAVDTDGCRFAVSYTDLDVRTSTFAYDPATSSLTAQDRRSPIATSVVPRRGALSLSNELDITIQ